MPILATPSSLSVAVVTRDPHIILFFSPFYFWFPITLGIFTHYSRYSPWLGYACSIEGLAGCLLFARRGDSVDVVLMYIYRICMGRKELGNEDNRAEKALLTTESDSINLVLVGVTGHVHVHGCRWCHHHVIDQWPLHEARLLQYMGPYGDPVTWFLVPLFSLFFKCLLFLRNFRIMCMSLVVTDTCNSNDEWPRLMS